MIVGSGAASGFACQIRPSGLCDAMLYVYRGIRVIEFRDSFRMYICHPHTLLLILVVFACVCMCIWVRPLEAFFRAACLDCTRCVFFLSIPDYSCGSSHPRPYTSHAAGV